MRDVELTLRTIASAMMFIAGGLYLTSMGILYFYADGMQRSVREYENPRDPLAKSGVVVVEHHEPGSRRFKTGYLELAKFDDIKGGRAVSFDAVVDLRDLLKPGEAPPAPALLGVFVQARAILYAQTECRALLRALARDCAVQYANGRIDDGRAVISGTLAFVQKDDFGALERGGTYVFSTASERDDRRSPSVALAAAARGRAALYDKIAARCAEIRRIEGN